LLAIGRLHQRRRAHAAMRVSGGRQSRQFQENLRAWPEGDRSSRATGSPPVRLIVATASSFVLADASVPCARFG
jgi:hypothetical protein